MLVADDAATPGSGQRSSGPAWRTLDLDHRGDPLGLPRRCDTAAIAALDAGRPRWVCADVAATYPALLRAGVRLTRAHDLASTDRLLRARSGDFSGAVGLPATPAPTEPGWTLFDADSRPARTSRTSGRPPVAAETGDGAEPSAAPAAARGADRDLEQHRRTLVDQLERMGGSGALRLLVAAESSAALTAVEMTAAGLPWRADRHRDLLERTLGPRPPLGQRPARLAELVDAIAVAFGFPVNPDSALDLRSAFARVGLAVENTRSATLRAVQHPAVPLVLDYKERARLFGANGWEWIDTWVRDGRFRPEYVPGGVVSGRWASRGGGALQIPRQLRRAVVADPGHRLIVADAAQAEPRVLAAVSGDAGLQQRAAAADLYEALAADGFGGDRARAKLALLGAMYGATSGEAGRLLPTLRRLYPRAMGHLQQAADTGAGGGTVTSVLGRACPPPSESWREMVEIGTQQDATATERSRADRLTADRSRFTRNFVVQGSAADWASVWLAQVRQSLLDSTARSTVLDQRPGSIVLFQHDEIVLHVPDDRAAITAEAVAVAAESASALVFPGSGVRIPVDPAIVDCYADKA